MATPATQQTTTVKAAAGGSFLLEERTPQEVFTPEDFNDEQRQIAETASNFAQKEILPAADAIEAKDYKVTRALLVKAGELGLMATDTPEEYGGLAMDKVTSAIVGERLCSTGQLRHHLQRARRHRHAAHHLVRHAGAEEKVSAEAGDR